MIFRFDMSVLFFEIHTQLLLKVHHKNLSILFSQALPSHPNFEPFYGKWSSYLEN